MDQTNLILMHSYLEVTSGSYHFIDLVLYRDWEPAFGQLIYLTVSFDIVSVATLVIVFSIDHLGQL